MQFAFILDKAKDDDASGIAVLQVECWRHNLSLWAPSAFVERFLPERQKERYSAYIQDAAAVLFVARRNGSVIGVIGAKPNAYEPHEYQQYIFGLYVAVDQQRRGVGLALIKRLFASLKDKGAKNAIIFTFAANIPARRLYEKSGGTLLPYKDSASLDLKIPHVSYGFHF